MEKVGLCGHIYVIQEKPPEMSLKGTFSGEFSETAEENNCCQSYLFGKRGHSHRVYAAEIERLSYCELQIKTQLCFCFEPTASLETPHRLLWHSLSLHHTITKNARLTSINTDLDDAKRTNCKVAQTQHHSKTEKNTITN